MEHRWGSRVPVDVPALLLWQALQARELEAVPARIADVSLSGALIHTPVMPPLFAPIDVLIGGESIPGWVVRHASGAVGVEWFDYAPERVTAILLEVTLPPRAAHTLPVPVTAAAPQGSRRVAL